MSDFEETDGNVPISGFEYSGDNWLPGHAVDSVREFPTGARRDTRRGKGRFDLLPPVAIQELAKHFEGGGDRFGDRNWEKGMPLSVYLDSALRHSFQVLEGKTDEPHAVAAMWNWACFVHTKEMIRRGELPQELDDLPVGVNRFPRKFGDSTWEIREDG